MKVMKWRRKLLGKVHEAVGDDEGVADARSAATSKKDKKKGKKWSLSRPPPVETSGLSKNNCDNKDSDQQIQPSKSERTDMPRISMELTMAELQDEALARGIERQYLPTKKADLLDFLVDGSIYLRKTKAWLDVERLKTKMEADCRRIEEEKTKDCSHTASVSDSNSDTDNFPSIGIQEVSMLNPNTHHRPIPHPHTTSHKELPPRHFNNSHHHSSKNFDLPDPVTFSTTRDASHLSSIQSTLPSRYVFQSYTSKIQDRSVSVRDRSVSIRQEPSMSFHTTGEDTALGQLMRFIPLNCGVPVCTGGGRAAASDKDSEAKRNDRKKEKELEEVIERRNQLKEIRKKESIELQQKMSIKWDASLQFEPWIISPPQNNQKPTGSMMKGYTVWCSISSDILSHPLKQFDATYKNLGDANDRARYLFYWRNPWQLPPPKMVEVVLVKSDNSSNGDCASTFHCVHPNGDKWIVSVVHDSTFKYLDHASLSRHGLDLD